MDAQVQAWREAGKHLPEILKDFHDQKDLFKLMHAMLGEPTDGELIKRPDWVEGQCYVMDCFLWFMARHGYTLQRSRKNLPFDSLTDNLKALQTHMTQSLP